MARIAERQGCFKGPTRRKISCPLPVFAALQARIAARLAAASTRSRWRTVAWAAEQSGLSAHFFYERASADHPGALPFLKRRGRTIRVEEAGFQRWIRSRG